MNQRRGIWLPVIFFIGLLYVLLRLWNLTETCLWFDEIFSVHAATQNWQNLFWFVGQDLIHPPFFYVLLKIWIQIGGESILWLRLFPLLFSIAALLPFYFLCRQLKIDLPWLALALSFLAVNGALIKYAQEVRMYSLLLCLSLFSLWLFVRFLNLGKSFTILVILNVLLVYTHYFGWLIVLTEAFAVGILQPKKLRRLLLMISICAVSFLPWILIVRQAAQINADFSQNLGWAAKPDLTGIFQFVFDLIEPFYFQQTSVDKSSVFIISVPLLLIFLSAFSFYPANRKNYSEAEKFNARLLLILCSTPILTAFTASWLFPFSVWGTRHLIIIFAPFFILLAFVISKISILYARLAVLGLTLWLTAMAFPLQLIQGTQPLINCAWENLAADLPPSRTDSGEKTKIYVFEDAVAYDFWFALRTQKEQFQIVKVNGTTGLYEDSAYFLPRGFDEIQKTVENDFAGDRFFIAFRDTELNESKPPLLNLREKNYKFTLRKTFEAQRLKAFLVEVEK